LHAESVTLPLLAPDVPVVTWWHGAPPDLIAHDPLGVFADRRITDCTRAPDPAEALRQRAADYAPGDTDLTWTRITPWRSQLASAADSCASDITGAAVSGPADSPSAQLLAGWLSSRLGKRVPVHSNGNGDLSQAVLSTSGDGDLTLRRGSDGHAQLDRGEHGQGSNTVPMPDRGLGELLAEELHRLDDDGPYADSLGAATGISGLNKRVDNRVHIWKDPSTRAAEEPQPS
jgi:glucose-6-phosphate dehydrogenase assembly protein OpcA